MDELRLLANKPSNMILGQGLQRPSLRRFLCTRTPKTNIANFMPGIQGIVNDKKLHTKSDRAHLNTTLAIRKDRGEHFYFCSDELNSQNTMWSEAVYAELKQDLSELDIICISTEQGQRFIIKDEAKLGAYLTDFFRNKPEY